MYWGGQTFAGHAAIGVHATAACELLTPSPTYLLQKPNCSTQTVTPCQIVGYPKTSSAVDTVIPKSDEKELCIGKSVRCGLINGVGLLAVNSHYLKIQSQGGSRRMKMPSAHALNR